MSLWRLDQQAELDWSVERGREFPDGQDLPLSSGTEGIGCFDHTEKIGIDVMP